MTDSSTRQAHFQQLRSALAERTRTDANDWFPVFKARYGMREVFEAIHATMGAGSVVTQLFTCCTAIDPIIVAGLKPVYADVSKNTIAIDPEKLDFGEYADPRALVVQNTFGILDTEMSDSSTAARLTRCAHERGLVVVEDSAHCVGRMNRDGAGLPLADFSVHSFGVEKIMPTNFGGAIWVNPALAATNPELDRTARLRLSELAEPSHKLALAMKMYWFEVRVLSHLPHALVTGLRSFLTQHGLFEPAITQSETRGELQYPSFAPSEWVAVQATGALKELTGNEENRRRIVEVYRHELSRFSELIERGGLGERWEIPEVILAGDAQPLLRFPLFAPSTAESDALIQQLRRRGIWAQAWYRPELFPGVTTPEKYGLDVLERSGVDVSLSRELIARVICLPTELSEQKAHEACEIICAR